jgi:Mrp family chromosome partitioning ATPase
MNTKHKDSPPAPATIALRDVYYILFRHKWLIASLVALGLVGSYAVHSWWPFPYSSQAKVCISYIQNTPGPVELTGRGNVIYPDERGANILNTELEILTSAALALQVATNIGPEKFLGKSAGSNNAAAAQSIIRTHLQAEVLKNCDIIYLRYSSKDPLLVQPVLSALIAAYTRKYVEVHLTPGVSDAYLDSKTDEARTRLQETSNALEDEKKKMKITSLEDAKKNQAERIARTEQEVLQARVDLAEAAASVKDLQERVSNGATNGPGTNAAGNLAAAAQPPPPSPEVLAKYRNLNDDLSSRRAREQALLSEFTPSNKLAEYWQKQRMAAEEDVKKLEAQNPGLIALKQSDAARAGSPLAPGVDPNVALRESVVKLHSLQAKYQELTNQLEQAQIEAVAVAGAENKIMQAQSEKDVADAEYKLNKRSAEMARTAETIENKVSNISTVEQPTPPSRDAKKVLNVTLGVLASFVVLAFALPFFIELVLDQTFKHPSDVQARIPQPFFITIPRTSGYGKFAALKRAKNVPLLSAPDGEMTGNGAEDKAVSTPANGQIAPWDERHELRPFFDTLRDRLTTYFEMINLTHKPKLVAVTSCSEGAGVTTTAAGLASSLSETGEGNVLLVNMNVRDGEAHHFYKGKLANGIQAALEREKREPAQGHENLYVAKETGGDDKLPRVLPKRFSHLVPMMKSSDYDYIIFDMPPVSEISITPRLARFMDMVLLVVESEKTARDAAVRAASLLAESKTNVGLVLNKNRSYVPKRLEQSL